MKSILLALLVITVSQTVLSQEKEKPKPRYEIFAIEKQVKLPGTPEQI